MNQIEKQVVERCSANQLGELLKTVPRITITATGNSMKPFINNGGRITLSRIKNPSMLQYGDIVLVANNSGTLLLHRIIRLTQNGKKISIQTKGDNCFTPDPPVSSKMLIAKVSRLEKKTIFPGRYLTINLETNLLKLISRVIAFCSRRNLPLYIYRISLNRLSSLRSVLQGGNTS